MGRFELAVMAGVMRLRDNAYGRSVCADLEERLGQSISAGQVYVALARLEQQGFVESEMSKPLAVRGGRSKRLYHVTSEGLRALNSERRGLAGIFHGLPVEG